MAGKRPPPGFKLTEWLGAWRSSWPAASGGRAPGPDLVVVGFQEVVPLSAGNVIAGGSEGGQWWRDAGRYVNSKGIRDSQGVASLWQAWQQWHLTSCYAYLYGDWLCWCCCCWCRPYVRRRRRLGCGRGSHPERGCLVGGAGAAGAAHRAWKEQQSPVSRLHRSL